MTTPAPVRAARAAASAYVVVWGAALVVVVAVALAAAFFDADRRAAVMAALGVGALVVEGAIVVVDAVLGVCLERYANSRGHRDVPSWLLAVLALFPFFTIYFAVRSARAATPGGGFPSGWWTLGAFLAAYFGGSVVGVFVIGGVLPAAAVVVACVAPMLVRLLCGLRVRRALDDLVAIDVDDRARGAAPVAG